MELTYKGIIFGGVTKGYYADETFVTFGARLSVT
jgi:hypothetical protein